MDALLDSLPLSFSLILSGLLVTTLAATVQSTIGFGFAITSVPLLSLIDTRLAPVPQLLLTIPLTLAVLAREWRSLDLRGVGWVVSGRVVGAGLGAALLIVAPRIVIDLSIAAVVLSAVFALTFVASIPRNRLTELAAGTVSGVGALVSSIGGPPLALLYRDASGSTLRSSLSAIFAIGLVITISTRVAGDLISLDDLILAICWLPGIACGLFLSQFLIKWAEGTWLKRSIVVVATLASLGLIIKALNAP